MKSKTSLALAALCLSFSAWAAPATDASIEQLLKLTQAESMIDAAYAQAEQAAGASMAEITRGQRLTPEQQAAMSQFPARLMQIIREEASWEKMQAELTGIYRELFTQEEINSLIDFYQSPAGQAMVKKMPLIQNKTVQIYQKILARAMPRIQKVMEETLKENHADHHHGNQTGETQNHPSP